MTTFPPARSCIKDTNGQIQELPDSGGSLFKELSQGMIASFGSLIFGGLMIGRLISGLR